MRVLAVEEGGRLVGIFENKKQITNYYLEGHKCRYCHPGYDGYQDFCPVTSLYRTPSWAVIREYETSTGEMIRQHKRQHKGAVV